MLSNCASEHHVKEAVDYITVLFFFCFVCFCICDLIPKLLVQTDPFQLVFTEYMFLYASTLNVGRKFLVRVMILA